MRKLYSIGVASAASVVLIACAFFAGGGTTAKATAKDNFSPELRRELAQVRRATAKYHDISEAMADGYVDIDVFIPQMGFHYLKPSFLDADFTLDKPELLVYAADPVKNRFRLVCVEYAVPTDLASEPPEGFTGDEDHWHRNEEFGLWTLHVWVWLENPNGMFTELNPRAP
jgi:hypothetical protein